MVPIAYHGFFSGCASVAGTLIGLLFVAISVSPHKDVGAKAPLAFQVQAGVAFTTLINALVIALAALLPGKNLGSAMVILSGAGISATIGLIVLSFHDRPGRRDLWGLVIIPALGVLYALQLRSGIDLLQRPGNPSPVHLETRLVIISFMVAIARSWQMIGARGTGVVAVMGGLLRERQHGQRAAVPDNIDENATAASQSAQRLRERGHEDTSIHEPAFGRGHDTRLDDLHGVRVKHDHQGLGTLEKAGRGLDAHWDSGLVSHHSLRALHNGSFHRADPAAPSSHDEGAGRQTTSMVKYDRVPPSLAASQQSHRHRGTKALG
jgi:hypothetical protein